MTLLSFIIINLELYIIIYCNVFVLFLAVWCPCMAINVSVHHNGVFLSDMVLLIQCFTTIGELVQMP